MKPFARTIDAAKKYVVSSTLNRVDWNAELVRGDLAKAAADIIPLTRHFCFVNSVNLLTVQNSPPPTPHGPHQELFHAFGNYSG